MVSFPPFNTTLTQYKPISAGVIPVWGPEKLMMALRWSVLYPEPESYPGEESPFRVYCSKGLPGSPKKYPGKYWVHGGFPASLLAEFTRAGYWNHMGDRRLVKPRTESQNDHGASQAGRLEAGGPRGPPLGLAPGSLTWTQICLPFLTVTVVSRRKPFYSFPEDDQFCSLDSIDFSLILYPEFVLPALIPFLWLLVCVLCSTFSPIAIPRKSLLSPLINKVYFFSPFSNLLMKRTDPSWSKQLWGLVES